MKTHDAAKSWSRRLRIAVCIWLVVVTLFCIPFHRSFVAAMPENLWTRAEAYSWHSSISSRDALPFQRTEYGLIWHFLVIDRGQGHPHWSARLEPRALLAYGFIGVIVAFLFFCRLRYVAIRNA
jgi:hypothetical protein